MFYLNYTLIESFLDFCCLFKKNFQNIFYKINKKKNAINISLNKIYNPSLMLINKCHKHDAIFITKPNTTHHQRINYAIILQSTIPLYTLLVCLVINEKKMNVCRSHLLMNI